MRGRETLSFFSLYQFLIFVKKKGERIRSKKIVFLT